MNALNGPGLALIGVISRYSNGGKRALREMPGGLNYRARGKTISPSADHHRVSNIGKRWNSFLSTVGQL